MISLYEIVKLSQVTLLVIFLLPFSYYGYQSRYWHSQEKLRLCDFLLQSSAAVLILLFFIFMYGAAANGDRDQMQWAMLHVVPLVLTFLAVSKGKGLGGMEGKSPKSA